MGRLLSYILNGLLMAKETAYPNSPEPMANLVYRLLKPLYVTNRRLCSFAYVELEDGISYRELVLKRS